MRIFMKLKWMKIQLRGISACLQRLKHCFVLCKEFTLCWRFWSCQTVIDALSSFLAAVCQRYTGALCLFIYLLDKYGVSHYLAKCKLCCKSLYMLFETIEIEPCAFFSPLAHSLINYMYWEMLCYYDLSLQCITSEVKFSANTSHQFTLTGNYPSYMEERHLNSLAFSALRVPESEIYQTDDIDFLLWNSYKH